MKIGTISSSSLSELKNQIKGKNSINSSATDLAESAGIQQQANLVGQQAERVTVDSRLSSSIDPDRQSKVDSLKKRVAEGLYKPDSRLVATALTKEIDDTIRSLR